MKSQKYRLPKGYRKKAEFSVYGLKHIVGVNYKNGHMYHFIFNPKHSKINPIKYQQIFL